MLLWAVWSFIRKVMSTSSHFKTTHWVTATRTRTHTRFCSSSGWARGSSSRQHHPRKRWKWCHQGCNGLSMAQVPDRGGQGKRHLLATLRRLLLHCVTHPAGDRAMSNQYSNLFIPLAVIGNSSGKQCQYIWQITWDNSWDIEIIVIKSMCGVMI